jgi:hypothetical protein
LNGHISPQAQIARPVHFAHAARTQQRNDFIVTKLGSFGQCEMHYGRKLQKAGAHMVTRSEQNLYFLAQGSITAAGSIQKGVALLRRMFERFPQQIANLLPAFRRHVYPTLLFSQCSHRRVYFVPRT